MRGWRSFSLFTYIPYHFHDRVGSHITLPHCAKTTMASVPVDLQSKVLTCTGYVITGSQLYDYWTANQCHDTLVQYVNTDAYGLVGFNDYNMSQLQVYTTNLFEVYRRSNQLREPSNNAFQQQLLNLCRDPALPNVCQPYLKDACPSLNGAAPSFCSCFDAVPPADGLPAACSPMCHRAGVVPNGPPCPNSVCVINDVSSQGNLKGDVNLLNLCPNCGPNSLCTCIIQVPLYQIGLGTQFHQYCGQDALCYLNGEKVPCENEPKISQFYNLSVSVLIGLIVIFLLGVIFLLLRYLSRDSKDAK